jgi:hypothetical protein
LTKVDALSTKAQAALVERLREAMVWVNSNQAFHSCNKQLKIAAVRIARAEAL